MRKIKKTRILLFMGTERKVGRDILTGIVKYADIHGPWQFYSPLPFYVAPLTKKAMIEDIIEWKPNGAILIEHEKKYPFEEILKLAIPTIVTYASRPNNPHYPTLSTDNETVGNMGAAYFMEHGFRNYAFCGYKDMPWSKERLESFSRKVKSCGHHFDYYEFGGFRKHLSWEKEHDALKKWLLALDKPVGLMACNDDYARDILTACQSVGIRIPDEIAILGVDNEELTCRICTPPLSSVNIDFERLGYDTAELMDSLLHGEPMKGQNLKAKPTHIEIRASSDIIAIEDIHLATAIRFIRENALKSIQVQDVAEAACISRRSLEIRFQKWIGHTIHRELLRVRVNKLAEMMLTSNLPLSKILYKQGFTDKHVARWFKTELGMTPSEFREKHCHK
jgi:LacI family transcriptional regulator